MEEEETVDDDIYLQTHPNPFVHRPIFKPYHYIQIFFFSIFIAPFRICAAIATIMLCSLVAVIEQKTRPRSERDPESNFDQQRLAKYKKVLYVLSRFYFFFLGFHRVIVKGKLADISEAPILVAAPHSSYFDALIEMVCYFPSVVSRAENKKIPLLGPLFNLIRPVYVSRDDKESKKNVINKIKARVANPLYKQQILIFPEGTTTNRQYLITFKQGAFIPGVPVQPCVIRYNNRFDSYSWTMDGPSGLKLLWWTLCQFGNVVTIEFLPPYYPSDLEKSDANLFAKNVRQVMADCLGVGVTDHTYEDCRLMMFAAQAKYPVANVVVECDHLRKKLNIDYDRIRELLDRYIRIDRNRHGKLSVYEFAECLSLPLNSAIKDMFRLFDRDGSGKIDFREFVVGIMNVCDKHNNQETWREAFKMFDKDGDENISMNDLCRILQNRFSFDKSQINQIFISLNKDLSDYISYDEFIQFTRNKPEYAYLFRQFSSIKREHRLLSVSDIAADGLDDDGTGGPMAGGDGDEEATPEELSDDDDCNPVSMQSFTSITGNVEEQEEDETEPPGDEDGKKTK